MGKSCLFKNKQSPREAGRLVNANRASTSSAHKPTASSNRHLQARQQLPAALPKPDAPPPARAAAGPAAEHHGIPILQVRPLPRAPRELHGLLAAPGLLQQASALVGAGARGGAAAQDVARAQVAAAKGVVGGHLGKRPVAGRVFGDFVGRFDWLGVRLVGRCGGEESGLGRRCAVWLVSKQALTAHMYLKLVSATRVSSFAPSGAMLAVRVMS